MKKRNNAFDLLRVLFCLFVLLSHGFFLGAYGGDPLATISKGQTYLAEVGLIGFFVLSGYLISSSYERSSNLIQFLSNRVLRIIPGFWVCLIVTSFILAPLIYFTNNHNLDRFTFFGANSSFSFVTSNFFLAIRQPTISNVLNYSASKDSLNGSLWTLFSEFQCYLFTIAAGLLGL
jgi:peptidoglycan/LPS O-acetylase OafA/YrhL